MLIDAICDTLYLLRQINIDVFFMVILWSISIGVSFQTNIHQFTYKVRWKSRLNDLNRNAVDNTLNDSYGHPLCAILVQW